MKKSELIRRAPMKRTMPKLVRGTDWPSSKGLKQESAPRRMKTKQRAVTPAEKVIWSKLAALGCVACMKEGNFHPHVSIHHVNGRAAPGCHMQVIPLCAGHHQDGTGFNPHMVAVHPWKARFERLYGNQLDLVAECMALIGEPV